MAIALSATYASTIILPGGDNLMCLRGIKCETDIDEPIVSSDDWDDTNECFVVLLERKMKVRGEMVEGCERARGAENVTKRRHAESPL